MRISEYLKDPVAAEAEFRAYAESLAPDFLVSAETGRKLNDPFLRDTVRKANGFTVHEWNTLGETERRMNILAYVAPAHCLW